MSEDKPDLCDATDTDDVYKLAYDLAAWGLRNGECDEYDALDWVLSHPHEDKLPRSKGMNPSLHHIKNGVRVAIKKYDPSIGGGSRFDPEPFQQLAARISGSGVDDEHYLLAAVSLCFRYKTATPVITGPLLAEIVGVSASSATDVLRKWSRTLAYGFITKVTYDGERGNGRVWHIDPGWEPVSKPKHVKGCNRSKERCQCPGLSQNTLSIIAAEKIDKAKCDRFDEWVKTLKSNTRISVTDVCKATGFTRYEAGKALRAAEGGLLQKGTFEGGRVRERKSNGVFVWVNLGECWFVA